MRLRLSVATAALLCGVAVVSGGAASAAARDASFALKPITYDPMLTATKSYFILATKPGAVIQDRIRVINTGGQTGTAYLYPVDATTGVTSGAVYLSRQSPRHDVGAWITLGRSRITLAPGANVIVPFTIHVPSSVRPGDHLGGIVAENSAVTQSSGHGALRIRIKHLTIDAVEVQLSGRVVARADVTGVKPGGEHGYQYVYLHLLNPGTIMIKPAGSLVIKNSHGRLVAHRSLLLDTFVPRTAIDYPALLPRQALSPGRYTATVNLHSGDQTVVGYRKGQGAPFSVTRTFSFTVSPKEQTKVYSGTAALAPPPSAHGNGGSKRDLVGPGLIALAALLGLGLAAGFGLRRRTRVRLQPPADGAVVALHALPPPVVTPVEEEEEPGWAGLLAPYASPRPDDVWDEPHEDIVAELPAEPAPADDLEPERLRELITLHDMADASISPANGLAAPEEPRPASIGRAPSRSRVDVDTNGVSTALLEASVIALAAVLAARLLKGLD